MSQNNNHQRMNEINHDELLHSIQNQMMHMPVERRFRHIYYVYVDLLSKLNEAEKMCVAMVKNQVFSVRLLHVSSSYNILCIRYTANLRNLFCWCYPGLS